MVMDISCKFVKAIMAVMWNISCKFESLPIIPFALEGQQKSLLKVE